MNRGKVLALSSLVGVGVALALLLVLTSTGRAATSRQLMNLQGRLTDAPGNPVNGNHRFDLRIFTQLSGGSPIFSETQATVPVNKGIYNVLVGDGTPTGIPAAVFNNSDLWLEIEVDQDNPLTPRTKVVSSAYAFNADTLDGNDSAAFAKVGSGNASNPQFTSLQVTNGTTTGSLGVTGNTTTGSIGVTGNTTTGTLTVGGATGLTAANINALTNNGSTTIHQHPSAGLSGKAASPNFSFDTNSCWQDISSVTFSSPATSSVHQFTWAFWAGRVRTDWTWTRCRYRLLVDGSAFPEVARDEGRWFLQTLTGSSTGLSAGTDNHTLKIQVCRKNNGAFGWNEDWTTGWWNGDGGGCSQSWNASSPNGYVSILTFP